MILEALWDHSSDNASLLVVSNVNNMSKSSIALLLFLPLVLVWGVATGPAGKGSVGHAAPSSWGTCAVLPDPDDDVLIVADAGEEVDMDLAAESEDEDEQDSDYMCEGMSDSEWDGSSECDLEGDGSHMDFEDEEEEPSEEELQAVLDEIPVHQLHLIQPHQLGTASASSAGAPESVALPPQRGTALAIRQRQDKACGGLGKRRLTRKTTVGPALKPAVPPSGQLVAQSGLSAGARPGTGSLLSQVVAPNGPTTPACRGKRRQTGGKPDDQDAAAADEAPLPDEPQAGEQGIPSYESIHYTHPQQRSPGRHRGRRTLRGKEVKKKRGKSLWWLTHSSETELFQFCVDVGYLTDRRNTGCFKCHQGALQVEDGRNGTGCAYVCPRSKCRYRESVTLREAGFFLPCVTLSKQMMVVYGMVHHWQPSVASLAADAEMDEHYVALLVANIRATVTWEMRRANALLQIGGVDEDCEADEVSFRSYKVFSLGVERVVWLRFVGAVRRGSSLVYWGELEDREVAAGQGGGGKINAEEVKYHVLERGSEHGYSARPLFHPWSVLHTGKSSEYLKLHRLSGLERYRRLKLWHTFVRHSRKKNAEGVWMPVQFTVRKRLCFFRFAQDVLHGGEGGNPMLCHARRNCLAWPGGRVS